MDRNSSLILAQPPRYKPHKKHIRNK